MAIRYIADGEDVNAVVTNRPLRDALTDMGLDPDGAPVAAVVTQTAGDARYLQITNAFTKAAADALYLPIGGTAAAALVAPWSGLVGVPTSFTPALHHATHATGGIDPIAAADIGALTQAAADARYVQLTNEFTQTLADARYVQIAGGTMTGALTVPGTFQVGDLNTGTTGWRVIGGSTPQIQFASAGAWRNAISTSGFNRLRIDTAITVWGPAINAPWVQPPGGYSTTLAMFGNQQSNGLGCGSPADVCLIANSLARLQVDTDATAGNLDVLLYDVSAAALVRVSRGAADSGGAGFRLLRIPN